MELLCLFGVHFFYDFHLQGEFIGKYKGKSIFILLIHSFTWAFLLSMVSWYFGHFDWNILVFWTVTHAGIDWMKAKNLTGDDNKDKKLLYIDQAAHAYTIVYAWLCVSALT